MEIVKQPDFQVFASEAKTGEVLKFPDILRGWGVTLEQTQGKPPLEWMNDAFKRIDLNNLYNLQQGIPEWHKSVRYPKDAVVKNDSKIYICLVENENNEPHLNSDKWTLYVKKATTSQAGIVQLTNTIDSTQDKAITPFAISELQKAIKEALRQAVPVGFVANYVGETAPNSDYLILRGQRYGKDQYPELYALIKTETLPDGRGVMLRGLDAGRGFDPGRTLLSYQEDAMQRFYGEIGAIQLKGKSIASGIFKEVVSGVDPTSLPNAVGQGVSNFILDASSQIRTSHETVSKNIAINIIIKVK